MLTSRNAEFSKKKYGQLLPKSMTAADNVVALPAAAPEK
jgi:hypothetical protein